VIVRVDHVSRHDPGHDVAEHTDTHLVILANQV
jgi:hypothetical protein